MCLKTKPILKPAKTRNLKELVVIEKGINIYMHLLGEKNKMYSKSIFYIG